ncbi:MAG: AAA family ATPase [Deltaproteobacteria bacterium]|nr:AAA family ATPase [Deltaproteobacteria bacterium]
MAFKDIIGHSEVIENLKKRMKENRLHHAIMFYGPQGIGKRTLAKEFIKALNCRNFDKEPCEKCNNCKWISENTHPDIIMITNGIRAESLGITTFQKKSSTGAESETSEGSPAELKREISIEQIRYLEDVIYTRPIEAKFRVIFIIDAETLNRNSANAFLKTMEEPPENTIIIMTTSFLGMVPGTIRSRAEKIRLKPLSDSDMKRLLSEKLKYSSDNINIIVHLLKGSLNRKILSIDNDSFREYLDMASDFVKREKITAEEILETAALLAGTSDREERELRIYIFFTILKELLTDIYLNRASDIWGEYSDIRGTIKFSDIENLKETIKFMRIAQNLYCNQGISIKSELLRLGEKWNRLSV